MLPRLGRAPKSTFASSSTLSKNSVSPPSPSGISSVNSKNEVVDSSVRDEGKRGGTSGGGMSKNNDAEIAVVEVGCDEFPEEEDEGEKDEICF